MALLSVMLSACGQLLLKAGATTGRETCATWSATSRLGRLASVETFGGLLCWGLSTLLWFSVLARQPLSHVYCLCSVNFILVPLAASWLFKEHLSKGHALGMALIALGIAVTLCSNQKGMDHALP
jgi:drug/metabolite transporter (DMT)-like permease